MCECEDVHCATIHSKSNQSLSNVGSQETQSIFIFNKFCSLTEGNAYNNGKWKDGNSFILRILRRAFWPVLIYQMHFFAFGLQKRQRDGRWKNSFGFSRRQKLLGILHHERWVVQFEFSNFKLFSETISSLLHIFLIRFFLDVLWELLGASLEPAPAHELLSKWTRLSSVHHAAHEWKLFHSWLASTRQKESFLVL